MHDKEVRPLQRRGIRRNIAVLLSTCIVLLYALLIRQWITANEHDKQFTQYVSHVVQAAGSGQRSSQDIRSLILIKAEELSLPIHAYEVHVSGVGRTLRASVQYKVDISMPIVTQPVYQMNFDHDLAYKSLY